MMVSILGGLGLFLLGMAVMTDGLRLLAGSALRAVLSKAAATPARGTLWGAVVTLLVQSSSATTMTTIGLVSAGLLTFPQALGVVFGANIGTTGTGWLVALLGVKVSLTPAAMPMLFVGALVRLLGRGRWAGVGGAISGFALLLIGLTVLQDGMAGLAERIRPEDLPRVGGNGLFGGVAGVVKLVLLGIVMTTVMQSSSAAVAATLSALHAGALAPDQAAALVIGQNIGTAVSSALAAVGATTPAKRTALAHVLFNIVTAVVVLAVFPLVAPFIARTGARMDATILLATFHTVYNLLGVAILLPVVHLFARLVERLLPAPSRELDMTRFLDRSVLDVPAVAVEAARRTVACMLRETCAALANLLSLPEHELKARQDSMDGVTHAAQRATDAAERTRIFLSELRDAPGSAPERERLASVLHALDHATRLAENAMDDGWREAILDRPRAVDETVAASLFVDAMRHAERAAGSVASPTDGSDLPAGVAAGAVSAGGGLQERQTTGSIDAAELSRISKELADLRRAHREKTLAAAASGELAADEAIARVEAVRLLDRMAYHAWRGVSHLISGEIRAEPIGARRTE